MPSHAQKILMCAPDFFGVDYVINPWMKEGLGKSDLPRAAQQWGNLKRWLEQDADLVFVRHEKGLPDMVFTANAGLVLGGRVILSRFYAEERRGEEAPFRAWFTQNAFEILSWPQNVSFEGAGDALFDRGTEFLWVGHGFRTDAAAPSLLEKLLGRPVVALKLIDPRFYHLDTCLCPLPGGFVMYYPAAFDAASQERIEAHVPKDKRLVVEERDAVAFACNAVDLKGKVFMNGASTDLQDALRHAGLTPIITPLSEFMKSGGAAKCLTLKLIEN